MMQQFQQAFEDSCNFVRLHGWVDQTNGRIAALQALIRADKSAWPDIASLFTTALDRVDSVEEKLMIFVLQADLGVAPQEIADQMYRHLHGRLTSKDSSFITSQFFHDLSPIPEEIVYDIIKRNFISYQRAIFQALKVNGFESAFSPEQILLFLIQLLCRNNLNEQNRAIIYLLLSRLDIELPPSIEQVVSTAMLGLRDVIQEVERRLEAVLSDTLTANELTLENAEWDDLETSAKPNQAEKRPVNPPSANPTPVIAHSFGISTEPDVPRPKEPEPKGMPYAGTYFDAPTNTASPAAAFSPETMPAKSVDPPRPAVVNPPPISNPATLSVAKPSSAAPSTNAQPSPEIAGIDTSGYLAGRNAPVLGTDQSEIISAGLVPGGPQTFQISFNRETTELKAVLQALQEISAAGGEGTLASDGLADRTNRRLGLLWPLFKAFFKSKWGIALIILAVAAIALVLLLRFGLTTPTAGDRQPSTQIAAKPMVDGANEAGTTKNQPAPIQGTVQISVDPTVNFAQNAPGGLPLIKSQGGQSIWYPRKGDSLWILYAWIRNDPQSNPALVALVQGEWQGFLKRVAALNPGMTFPDSIYPDKPIVILAKP